MLCVSGVFKKHNNTFFLFFNLTRMWVIWACAFVCFLCKFVYPSYFFFLGGEGTWGWGVERCCGRIQLVWLWLEHFFPIRLISWNWVPLKAGCSCQNGDTAHLAEKWLQTMKPSPCSTVWTFEINWGKRKEKKTGCNNNSWVVCLHMLCKGKHWILLTFFFSFPEVQRFVWWILHLASTHIWYQCHGFHGRNMGTESLGKYKRLEILNSPPVESLTLDRYDVDYTMFEPGWLLGRGPDLWSKGDEFES